MAVVTNDKRRMFDNVVYVIAHYHPQEGYEVLDSESRMNVKFVTTLGIAKARLLATN